MRYQRLLQATRFSGEENSSLLEATENDRARVVQSAPVRRLQQKTQVFPLDVKASVRSRLTHSLEVQQVGRQIIARQQGSGNPYAQWIETYADPSFTEATSQAIGICDALAEKTGPETRRRMTDIFLRCTKMEWLFWDSAWYLESWKI